MLCHLPGVSPRVHYGQTGLKFVFLIGLLDREVIESLYILGPAQSHLVFGLHPAEPGGGSGVTLGGAGSDPK